MLHGEMAPVTVRVVPRSGRSAVEAGPEGIVVEGVDRAELERRLGGA
jgi:hypothetical protein